MPPIDPSNLLTAGIDLLGSLFGFGSAYNTNKSNERNVAATNAANMRIAERNNQTMREMQQQKMQFDTNMWNMQNAYNSPVEQVKRLRAAGFNPYLQNVQTGNATSSPSMSLYTPQAATMQAYQQDPNSYGPAIDRMSGIAQRYASLRAQQLANQNQAIANKHQEALLLKTLADMDLKVKGQELQNAAQNLMNDYQRDTYQFNVEQVKENLIKTTYENDLLKKQLDFLPVEQQQAVQRFTAEMAMLAVQKDLTKQQIRNLIVQSGYIREQTEGLRISNNQQRRMTDAIVDNAFWTAKTQMFMASKTSWDARKSYNNRHPENPWQESFNRGKGGEIWRSANASASVVLPWKGLF